jgi:chemotaxis protein histidine kinase CheA
MALKLSSRQQAQMAYLQTIPPKLQRIHNVIEDMAGLRADESVVRSLCRVLDEIKGNAQALGMPKIAETTGIMGTMARRSGGLQMRVRGLRELLGSLRIGYDAALKAATTPEKGDEAPDAP